MNEADNHEPLDPAVPLLTGWLLGCIDGRGRRDFMIRKLLPRGLDAVEVHFQSGTVVLVKVVEVRP